MVWIAAARPKARSPASGLKDGIAGGVSGAGGIKGLAFATGGGIEGLAFAAGGGIEGLAFAAGGVGGIERAGFFVAAGAAHGIARGGTEGDCFFVVIGADGITGGVPDTDATLVAGADDDARGATGRDDDSSSQPRSMSSTETSLVPRAIALSRIAAGT